MKAFLSLGSNIGDRGYYLTESYKKLEKHPEIRIQKVSSIYETAPWGVTDQEDFWNIVIELDTDLQPLDLLDYCQEIENHLGRVRLIRWGPRTIDIDILIYDNMNYKNERLILPHPRMEEREFVLAPLREICPNYILPSGRNISDIQGDGQVKLIGTLKVTDKIQ